MSISTRDGTFTVLSVEQQLKGDINGDGRFTAVDALAALQMAVGKRAVDLVLDVSGDGKVTSLDARRILQMAIGIVEGSAQALPAQLIAGVAAARTEAERRVALERLIAQGYSLGVLDERGNQLNRNVEADAASLNADDLAALSWLTAEGYSRPIGSVVDFLAAAGVTLASTGNVITFQDFLPDLQRYVDWSFQNRGDPRAALGLLLASGPEMRVPASPPIFTQWTPVSPAASMLMLADVLLGVKKPAQKQASGWFGSTAYAAEELGAAEIQGLLTRIAPILNGSAVKVAESDERLLAGFRAGNRFAVRLLAPDFTAGAGENVFKQCRDLELPGGKYRAWAMAMVVQLPSGKLLQEVSVQFTLNLISAFDKGFGVGPLYPDADLVLVSDSAVEAGLAKVDLGGHRLGIVARSPVEEASFQIRRPAIANPDPRAALLLASASVQVPELTRIFLERSGDALEDLTSIMSADEFVELYSAMKTGIPVVPWVCKVLMAPRVEVTIEPVTLQSEPGKECTFTASVKNPPEDYTVEWEPGGQPSSLQPLRGGVRLNWDAEGTYTVRASVIERDFDEVVASATARAIIESQATELSGPFPAASFRGMVRLVPGAIGASGLNDAGLVQLNLSSSGKVSGTWQGELEDQNGKPLYAFKGSFSGSAQSPEYLRFADVVGDYEVRKYNSDGTLAETTSGRWELRGAIDLVVDPAGGPPRVGGAKANIWTEKGLFGDWESAQPE